VVGGEGGEKATNRHRVKSNSDFPHGNVI